MPIYEYHCDGCGEEFTRVQSIRDHDSSPPACPSCGGVEVRQLFRSVNVKTSKKS